MFCFTGQSWAEAQGQGKLGLSGLENLCFQYVQVNNNWTIYVIMSYSES